MVRGKKAIAERFRKLGPKVRELLGSGKGPWQIGKELNLAHSTVQGWIRKIEEEEDDGESFIGKSSKENPPKIGAHFVQEKSTASASLTDTKIRTLDDLIRVCQVDMDVWECVHFDVKCWEMGRKDKRTNMVFVDGVSNGNTADSGRIFVQPLYSVVARFKRMREKTSEELAEHFRSLLGTMRDKTWTLKPHYVDAKNTLELMIPDLHLGSTSWSPETRNEDYNIKIACELLRNAVRDLVNEAGSRIKRIALPIGNDFFNVDSMYKETTKGTPQDEEGRWQQSFRTGCRVMMEIIGELSTRFEVDVLVIPGNHDEQRSFYMGEVMAAYFHNNDRVTVDNSPHSRKYRLYGCTLVGYVHGDQESPKDLPMIMAHQEPSLWSKSVYREWHHGHLHHERNNEVGGIKLRHFPALVPPDAWHSKKGYVVAVRQACAIEYSGDGPIRQYNWFPAMAKKNG